MPAMRPSQLSALKVLDPPDDQGEHREDDDSERYVQQIRHGATPWWLRLSDLAKPQFRALSSGPCSPYAGSGEFLTMPMRASRTSRPVGMTRPPGGFHHPNEVPTFEARGASGSARG